MDLVEVDCRISHAAGHVGVHLRDDQLGAIQRRRDHIHRDAQTDIAKFVRQRNLDQGHVNRDAAQFHQLRDLGDGNGYIFGQTLFDRGPDIRANEKGAVMVFGAGSTIAVRHGIRGDEMHQFDVVRRIRQVLKRGHDGTWGSAGRADKHMLTRANQVGGGDGRDDFVLVRRKRRMK